MTVEAWDMAGHVGYATLVVGQFLIGRRLAWGWPARIVGDLITVGLGCAAGLTSVALWGAVFAGLDAWGWRQWTRGVACPSCGERGRELRFVTINGLRVWDTRVACDPCRVAFIAGVHAAADAVGAECTQEPS